MQKEVIMVPVVAGVVVKQDGKYLLVQEKQPKAYGYGIYQQEELMLVIL